MQQPSQDGNTIQDVQKQLDSLEDSVLLGMYHDIQKDPAAFAEHVGVQGAADFMASLIEELTDRNLIFADSEEVTLPDIPSNMH
jgi:hypothetical protein